MLAGFFLSVSFGRVVEVGERGATCRRKELGFWRVRQVREGWGVGSGQGIYGVIPPPLSFLVAPHKWKYENGCFGSVEDGFVYV